MNWYEYFFAMSDLTARKSKDPSTKCGAVIVSPDYSVISTGYNGLPRGVNYHPELLERPEKYLWFEHAERNAIYNAAREGSRSLKGCTIFTTPFFSCANCARAIIQVGISQARYRLTPVPERWYNECTTAYRILTAAGVIVWFHDGEGNVTCDLDALPIGD